MRGRNSTRKNSSHRDLNAELVTNSVPPAAETAKLDVSVDTKRFADASDIQSRPERRRKRAACERGLPPDAELTDLAKEYLTVQRQLWPDLVKKGLLPEPTTKVIADMVEDFKYRHGGGRPDKGQLTVLTRARLGLFGFYGRYSCDNSSPKSIVAQAVNCLRDAKEKRVFSGICG